MPAPPRSPPTSASRARRGRVHGAGAKAKRAPRSSDCRRHRDRSSRAPARRGRAAQHPTGHATQEPPPGTTTTVSRSAARRAAPPRRRSPRPTLAPLPTGAPSASASASASAVPPQATLRHTRRQQRRGGRSRHAGRQAPVDAWRHRAPLASSCPLAALPTAEKPMRPVPRSAALLLAVLLTTAGHGVRAAASAAAAPPTCGRSCPTPRATRGTPPSSSPTPTTTRARSSSSSGPTTCRRTRASSTTWASLEKLLTHYARAVDAWDRELTEGAGKLTPGRGRGAQERHRDRAAVRDHHRRHRERAGRDALHRRLRRRARRRSPAPVPIDVGKHTLKLSKDGFVDAVAAGRRRVGAEDARHLQDRPAEQDGARLGHGRRRARAPRCSSTARTWGPRPSRAS